MHHSLQEQLARGLNRAMTRLRRARPASVLILVVALLVLMALIGTAFISTARVDRYSATQNTYNTQLDLLTQGMEDLAQAALTRNLQNATGVFRPGSSATINPKTKPGGYNPWESMITDLYLADRVPPPEFYTLPVANYPGITPIDPNAIGAANNQDYFPTWLYITAPLNASPTQPSGQFEAPYAVDWNLNPVQSPVTYVQYSGSTREQALPWAISVPQPDGSTKMFPAFVATPLNSKLKLIDGKTPATLPIIVVAADTDGDGIADAGFIRLPGGQVEGATYYGAVRIIDNAAAFNASIALGINPYPPPGKSVPGNLFASNINLQGFAGDSLAALNKYRFNNGASNNGANFNAKPIDDTGVTHTDFAFSTPTEALWTQLGARLNNPGYNASKKYQALPISEGMNLAHDFCLTNPSVVSTSPSLLETYLPISTKGPASNHVPYTPGNFNSWFQDQFNYNFNGAASMPLRAILVARNPVSNFVPTWFVDQGRYGSAPLNGAAAYSFGDRVQFTDANTGQMRGFVCIQPHAVGSQMPMNGSAYNNAYWAAMPWTSHPTKINANTGTFGQLWSAYWSVMQDSPDSKGIYPGATAAQTDVPAPNNQFRSPIRSTAVTALTRSQVIQLRSALAAVNTIDMRDGDTDITSRTIKLVDKAGANPVYANVYGAERQPYFSALLVDYEPSSPTPRTPYVVVELYNPHPVPVLMTGWKLAALTRTSGLISLKEVGDLSTTLKSATHAGGQTGPVILPGERIVLHNLALQPTNITIDWTTNKVTSYTNQPVSTTNGGNLDLAVGNELVLLRPRATGAVGVNTAAENTYTEKDLVDLVPLDNIDLRGLAPSSAVPPQPQRFRYARANQITTDYRSAAWHCVYPGPYNLGAPIAAGPSSPAFPYHHLGLLPVLAADIPANNGLPPIPADNGNFGRPNSPFVGAPTPTSGSAFSAAATYETRPLKINSLDLAGPNRPYTESLTAGLPNGGVKAVSGTGMIFPVGGFARRGDMLEVPFIGSYVISSTPDPSATGAKVYEMNSVTMDSVYAQFLAPSTNIPLASSYDQDTTYTQYPVYNAPAARFHNEQIGHFCPMSTGRPIANSSLTGSDFTDDPTDVNFAKYQTVWTYHWAKRLFDYLDIFTPQDAYLPNVDPAVTSAGASGDPSVPGSSTKYPGASATPLPVPISSSPVLAVKKTTGEAMVQQLQGLADTAGSEGQININTASWNVLSAIPFFTPDQDPNYAADNVVMGYSLWSFRETPNTNAATPHADYGPFRSIFDIMNVPVYTIYQQIWATSSIYTGNDNFLCMKYPGETNNQYGNLSPFAATFPVLGAEQPSPPGEADPVDHVFGDVKSRFLGFTRISNLITTRSDSFTIYAQVQGWQNVGTPTPNMVATKRAAMLFDRTQVKPVRVNQSSPVMLTRAGINNVPND
jgi:hypothetical protein